MWLCVIDIPLTVIHQLYQKDKNKKVILLSKIDKIHKISFNEMPIMYFNGGFSLLATWKAIMNYLVVCNSTDGIMGTELGTLNINYKSEMVSCTLWNHRLSQVPALVQDLFYLCIHLIEEVALSAREDPERILYSIIV